MSDAIAIARRLASAHPEVMLPCPVCATSLRASNLDAHLGKVHAGVAASGSFVGHDRRVVRDLFVVCVVLGALSLGLEIASGGAVTLWLGALVGFVAIALGGALGGAMGLFRARLVIGDDRVRLEHTFGLRRCEVPLRSRIEVGRIVTVRPEAGSASDVQIGTEVDHGAYLRLVSDAATITVGVRRGTGFRKHWADRGFRSGERRQRWDVTVDRAAMVALEYALAAAGVLSPREQP